MKKCWACTSQTFVPVEIFPVYLEAVRKNPRELTFRGHWRHQRKNGQIFEVEITTQGTVLTLVAMPF